MSHNKFVYQIFPASFKDGEMTGSGNLKGIEQKIDYLKWLGITHIWISPFYLSPFKDSGYDVKDYYKIDQQFGTMEDFDNLVSKAKKNKIDIILDMVFNHTSAEHEWFLKAINGEKKYQDYYIFKENKNNKEPTNWKSKMGGSCWEYVENINMYYLHLFAKDQPDLNWKNSDVQNEIIKILNFWANKGVNGFRLDVCNLYDKPDIFEDDYEGDGRRFYTDGKNIEKYFKFMNENVFHKNKSCFVLGEISSTTKEKAAPYARENNNELNSLFTFWHLKVDYKNNNKWTYLKPNLKKLNTIFSEWQMYFQKQNSNLALFMNNHDQPRSVSRFGNDKKFWFESATSIFTYVTLMRGTPVIYQGEEIGMTNYDFSSINDFWDIETIGNLNDLKNKKIEESKLLKIFKTKARESARTVMQWSNKENAGFCDKDIICKQKINKNYKKINVENQMLDNNSILNYYRKVIKLRKEIICFSKGKINFLDNNDIFTYKREYKDTKIIVISNWENKSLINNIDLKNYNIIINNYNDFDYLNLEPYQTVVLMLNKNNE